MKMKNKILSSVVMLALFVLPASSVGADGGLSSSEMQTITPSLSQALTSLQSLLFSIQTEMRREEMVITNSVNLLGSYSATLSATPAPSAVVLQNMKIGLDGIKNNLENVVHMRVTIINSLGTISTALRNIISKM